MIASIMNVYLGCPTHREECNRSSYPAEEAAATQRHSIDSAMFLIEIHDHDDDIWEQYISIHFH